jgi:PPM family protein phosphatase
LAVFVNIRHANLTDVGVKRSHNQDACASQPAGDAKHWESHGHVFIVADGMGGHAVGEKASAKAVRDIPLTYVKHVAQEGVVSALRRAFQEANASIFQIGVNNPEFKGLGTTGTALILRPEGAWVGHVGDSRAYRIRGTHVQQLTFDHSWVWEVARRQGIDPDELGDFKRNVIIRSLGPDAEVEVDIEGPHPVEPGDTFLMCSDGLTNEVKPDEIGAVVAVFPPDKACQFLVQLANIRGGRDNVTCLIAQIPAGSKAFQAAKSGIVKRAVKLSKAVDRFVPWPFLTLAIGAVIAAVSVGLQSEGLREVAIPAFLLSALLILSGLVGLYMHLRKKAAAAEEDPLMKTTSELHLYRDYNFTLDREIVERFQTLDVGLIQACKDRPELDAVVDWKAHNAFVTDADDKAKKDDWINAFAARFQAAMMLATAYNKHRNKDEDFRPNW